MNRKQALLARAPGAMTRAEAKDSDRPYDAPLPWTECQPWRTRELTPLRSSCAAAW